MSKNTKWSAKTSAENPGEYLGPVEFQDNKGEFHDFEVVRVGNFLVFGGACNVGMLESGFIELEDSESEGECLQELLADLETFYNDGPDFVLRIVFNERM